MYINLKIKLSHLITIVCLFIALSAALTVYAGDPVTPDAPPDSSSWYSLNDLYDRLSKGTTGAPTVGFDEPAGSPGATMHSINEIMSKAPLMDNDNGAFPSDVRSGKSYWGLRSGNWGLITGTMPNAVVPQTGQTLCFNDTEAIECNSADFPAQDGSVQKGVASPTPRFTESDGIITDNLTDLVWLKDANCMKTHYPEFDNDGVAGDGKVTWQHALQFIEGINRPDLSGQNHYPDCNVTTTSIIWRLPNLRELQSLIDYSQSNPALSAEYATYFTNVQSSEYWSSTTNEGNPASAWTVFLHDGDPRYGLKGLSNYVWPVGNIGSRRSSDARQGEE